MTIRTVALIAAFNEAGSIARVVEGVRGAVAHVLVVDDGSGDATAALARAAGAEVVSHEANRGKGHAVRTGLARVFEGDFTHVLLLDGDLQHLPQEAERLLAAAAASTADVVLGQRQFTRGQMPASRYYANRLGSRVLSAFMGVPVGDTQCGFRVFRVGALAPLRLRATGYDIETEMLVKVRRNGGRIAGVPITAVYAGGPSKLRPVRDTTRTCLLAVYYRYLERMAPHADSNAVATPGRGAPVAWTRHGLNTGFIFGLTCRGVRALPRRVSYAMGDAGSWLAWRLMRRSRAAVADNLRAIFPDETGAALERRALGTFRAYARDVVDYLSALRAAPGEVRGLFAFRDEDARLFDTLLARGRGIILVTGHYGNWEAGAIFMRRVMDLPLTIVALTEASAEVNRIRRDIRDAIGADTIEVRKSLDTPLQIRGRLAANRVVAMLMDRHLGRDRVEVTLLGRKAGFLRTPPLMAFLTGAPLVPCFIERIREGRFQVQAGTPIFVSADLRRDEAIQDAAQRFADQLDVRLRAHPDFWYHFYSYWDAQRDTGEPS